MFPQLESNTGCSRIKIQSEGNKKKSRVNQWSYLPLLCEVKQLHFIKIQRLHVTFLLKKKKILKAHF